MSKVVHYLNESGSSGWCAPNIDAVPLAASATTSTNAAKLEAKENNLLFILIPPFNNWYYH